MQLATPSSRTLWRFTVAFCAVAGLGVAGGLPLFAQNVPGDLEIVGTAGGLRPDAPYAVVRIGADGDGSYMRFPSADVAADAEESSSFTVSNADLELLWQTIEQSNFFGLDESHAADGIVDRTFAQLIITANGTTHRVQTRDLAVAGFDDIISAINEVTPGDDDLIYDTSEPAPFTPLDICELPRKSGAPEPLSKPPLTSQRKMDGGTALPGPRERLPSTIASSSSLNRMVSGSNGAQNGAAHPGTVIAHRISLQEAVDRGIVKLEAKGGTISGDGVSIDIDNSSNQTSDRLELTLYLEFWGPLATPAVAAAVASAIESVWGGKMTSGGQTLHVNVVTRVSSGATAPPGTAGYHQIKMVPENSEISHVNGDFDVNMGAGGGVWETSSPITQDLIKLYAHEAGHLFGLDDQYEEYTKLPDGNWLHHGDDMIFTPDELADLVAPFRPDLTHEQILQKLNDGRQRMTHPKDNHGDDLMATGNGSPRQSDIDALAAQAGVIVEVRPGDILVNGQGEQNYVITRSEDVFVPANDSVTLGGLYVACIDVSKSIPKEGTVFDVAPSLSQWNGIEAAGHMQKVVDYINENAFFCPGASSDEQSAIWRLSDNSFGLFGYEPIEQFLLAAGVDIGDRPMDFPKMSDPNPDDSITTNRLPAELFVPRIATPSGSLLNATTTVQLSGTVDAPAGALQSASFTWTFEEPASSNASLTNTQGAETSFTTDARGTYRVMMNAHVTDANGSMFEREPGRRFAFVDEATETFEAGSLRLGRPFYWETSGEHPWIVTDREVSTGAFSAASADIEDGASTVLQVTFDQVSAAPLSFSYRVSSESGFDYLRFAIDGDSVSAWSGNTGWDVFSIELAAGTHTATWTYRKDGSLSVGADRAWVDDVFFPVGAVFTAIEEPDAEAVLPSIVQLAQNYPNPFNPSTTISYSLPDQERVTLQVFDALGRRVATLVEAAQSPGAYEVRFDARDLPSGTYYYELRAGGRIERRSMVLMR